MIFRPNWLLFSWILFHKKKIVTKHDNYANDLLIEPKITLIRPNITDGNNNYILSEIEEDIEKNTLFKIKRNIIKSNQLQLLESSYISIIEKLLIVKELERDNVDSVYISNIHKGGLWKDWE